MKHFDRSNAGQKEMRLLQREQQQEKQGYTRMNVNVI